MVAHVEQVLQFDKFVDHARPLPNLQYFLVGRSGELFLAHVITRAPDFDQVIGVRLNDQEFSEKELSRAMSLSVAGRSNSPKQRLQAGEQLEASVEVPGREAAQPLTVHLEVGEEVYFETKDLAM